MVKDFAKKEEVISLLKQGCELFHTKNEVTGSSGQTIYLSWSWNISDCKNINRLVHHKTIESLMNGEIIQKEKPWRLIKKQL